MRSRPHFTPCRIYYDIAPGQDPPKPGDYVQAQGKRGPGATYAIDEVRQNRNQPQRWNLHCRRWPPDQIPHGALVLPLYWYPRKRKAGRRLSSMHGAT